MILLETISSCDFGLLDLSSFSFQKNAAVIEEELKTTKRKMNLKIQEVREKTDVEGDVGIAEGS